jgi:hypothetical protein
MANRLETGPCPFWDAGAFFISPQKSNKFSQIAENP